MVVTDMCYQVRWDLISILLVVSVFVRAVYVYFTINYFWFQVFCHIIQLIFLLEGSYFKSKNEFVPIIFTYYVTLFVVVISLVVQISCFSYAGKKSPCYFLVSTINNFVKYIFNEIEFK